MRGIEFKERDLKYLRSCNFHAEEFSKDPSTQVAAIILDDATGREISRGYNGFPKNIHDAENRLTDRDTKIKLTLHAERNALFFAGAWNTIGKTLYCSHFPCLDCTLQIVQGQIGQVVTWDVNEDKDILSRWRNSMLDSLYILREADVKIYFYSPSNAYENAKLGVID